MKEKIASILKAIADSLDNARIREGSNVESRAFNAGYASGMKGCLYLLDTPDTRKAFQEAEKLYSARYPKQEEVNA